MIEQTLQKIGLTEGEIKVYVALLEIGSSSISNIIKKSGVSGSKTYEVLDRLATKGLVSYIIKNNVKYFEAASPNKIIAYLEEKQESIDKEKLEVQKIIPQLLLKQSMAESAQAKIFTGWEGIKTASNSILELKKGEEWLSMGITEQPESWEIYFNNWQKERAKRGIILKQLLNQKYKRLYEARKNLIHTHFRFLSKEFEMPTSTEIYGNNVMILVLLQESPLAIIIENKSIADSFRKYFYAMWEIAKK